MNKLYIALDGDNVGARLEYLSFTNDIAQLKEFSKLFSQKMEWLKQELVENFNAEIIIYGGDNVMASISNPINMQQFILSLGDLFTEFQTVGNSLSAGIGNNPREAFIALNFAKASGKNRIKIYGDYDNEN